MTAKEMLLKCYHDSPTGQAVDSFNKAAAALASRGYVCIAPNVRGSTGYGMEF